MSDQEPPFDGSPRESFVIHGPPYPPRNQVLGGGPSIIPDVPVTAAFLALYLIFGIIHVKIFRSNKGREHKFVFNGAILGLCKIRVITMALRMAWTYHPRNVGLGLAANIFVYVGTIILFAINWFFVQRIVRAQHQRLGWSTAYRIFHRGALVVLVVSLIMVILANVWQFYTLNENIFRVLRALQLTGQTYFTVFSFAPAVLVLISVLIPRNDIEKFGAGRLSINISILLFAVTVLTIGQLFRCVVLWIPQTPVRGPTGRLVEAPWYLHKICFYVFNFVTEVLVVIMFAIVRVDIRFHVPNGSRMSGDYSGRNSRANLHSSDQISNNLTLSAMASQKSLACESPIEPLMSKNDSNETLHQYNTSIFEDSHTLADSLKFGSSTLEIDSKTGTWKVKRISTGSSSRGSCTPCTTPTRSSLQDRTVTFADQTPPVPNIPSSTTTRPSTASLPPKQRYYPHTQPSPKRPLDTRGHAIRHSTLSSPDHNAATKPLIPHPDPWIKGKFPATPPPLYNDPSSYPNDKSPTTRAAPRKRAVYPPKSALKTARVQSCGSGAASSKTLAVVEQPEGVRGGGRVRRVEGGGSGGVKDRDGDGRGRARVRGGRVD
ncbi:hypothetical protein GQ44DRAFT_670152 [Phaeosphaeriaceae sp. PMI808]|nr:hypothetical protein GQ44DRAFT_670152 [Phaeosphaeriaceae sp. PMI808]